jgi:hypothetical protein
MMEASLKGHVQVMMDPLVAGILAATIHHLLVQYPYQARLFTTFYSIAWMNAVFVILVISAASGVGRRIGVFDFLKDWIIFDAVYVCIHSR